MSYDIDLRPTAPPSSEARAKHKEVVAALLALNPHLDVFESDTVIELSDVNDGSGLQVSLFADSGSVSIPYWHEEQAATVLQDLSRYLRVVCEVGGYSAFDPQTGNAITADTGYSLNSEVYSAGVHALNVATAKPWWKFW